MRKSRKKSAFCRPKPLEMEKATARSGTMDRMVVKVKAEARMMQWSAKKPVTTMYIMREAV